MKQYIINTPWIYKEFNSKRKLLKYMGRNGLKSYILLLITEYANGDDRYEFIYKKLGE